MSSCSCTAPSTTLRRRSSEELEGKAELIVSKQRNGPTGVVDLFFQKAYTRFDSVAPGAVQERLRRDGGYGP